MNTDSGRALQLRQKKLPMRPRSLIGTGLGIITAMAAVLYTTGLADTYWPHDIARTLENKEWYLWSLLLIFCHFIGGALGGGTAAAIIREKSSRLHFVVATGLLTIGALQIIGEWGHPFRFFWSMILLLATLAGVLVGWLMVMRLMFYMGRRRSEKGTESG